MRRINLIPVQLRKVSSYRRVKTYLIKSLPGRITILVVVLVISLPIYHVVLAKKYNARISARKNRIIQLRKKLKTTKSAQDQITQEKSEVEENIRYYQKRVSFLQEAAQDTVKWSQILFIFTKSTPSDMWLENISLNREKIALRGTTSNNLQVSDFMRKLEKSGRFKTTAFTFTQRKEDDGSKTLVDFEIVTGIKD